MCIIHIWPRYYGKRVVVKHVLLVPFSAVDCQWAPWGPWGDCSENCGKGSRNRTRAISVQPSFGGVPCQDNQGGDAENCNLEPCGKSSLTLSVHPQCLFPMLIPNAYPQKVRHLKCKQYTSFNHMRGNEHFTIFEVLVSLDR